MSWSWRSRQPRPPNRSQCLGVNHDSISRHTRPGIEQKIAAIVRSSGIASASKRPVDREIIEHAGMWRLRQRVAAVGVGGCLGPACQRIRTEANYREQAKVTNAHETTRQDVQEKPSSVPVHPLTHLGRRRPFFSDRLTSTRGSQAIAASSRANAFIFLQALRVSYLF